MNELARVESSPITLADDERDAVVVSLWIAGNRSRHTRRAYKSDSEKLLKFLGKPLRDTTLGDLQAFHAQLETDGFSPTSIKRILSSAKSLFSFASDDGIRAIPFNVAAAIKLPQAKNRLNERILSESQVQQLIAAAKPGRDRFLIELAYRVGVRVEELVTLKWRDAQPDRDGGVLTLFGKGEKTRFVRLDAPDWAMIMQWRKAENADDDPIVLSRSGGSLSTVQAWRIVHQAAKNAGLNAGVSPHWLRHAHATHALEHGADIRELQLQLGHSSVSTTEGYVHARPKKSSGAYLPRFDPPKQLGTEQGQDSTPPCGMKDK